MRKKLPFLASVLMLLCVSSRTAADPITVNFDVAVTVAQGPFEELFAVSIGVGDLLRGSFTYDPSAPDRSPVPDFGFYDANGQTLRIDLGTGLTLPIESYQVFDNARCIDPQGCDVFVAVANTGTFPGFDIIEVQADFRTPAVNRQGDGLPQSLAELASVWGPGFFRLDTVRPNRPDDFGHIISGTLQLRDASEPIPEPATMVLIGSGAAGVIAHCRRRKRHTSCSDQKLHSRVGCGPE